MDDLLGPIKICQYGQWTGSPTFNEKKWIPQGTNIGCGNNEKLSTILLWNDKEREPDIRTRKFQ